MPSEARAYEKVLKSLPGANMLLATRLLHASRVTTSLGPVNFLLSIVFISHVKRPEGLSAASCLDLLVIQFGAFAIRDEVATSVGEVLKYPQLGAVNAGV